MTHTPEEYIEFHTTPLPEWLYKIYRQTNLRVLNGRMCSGPVQGELLRMLTLMIKPARVLELGTFSGFSSLCIALGLSSDSRLDTIEADDELESVIRSNYYSAPVEISNKITLHIGNALDIMKGFSPQSFDMVFIDADKREYSAYYQAVFPLVKVGGFILADNTLWDGHVIDPAYNKDKQTLGIRNFNDMVAADPRVSQVIVPVRDGLTILRIEPEANHC